MKKYFMQSHSHMIMIPHFILTKGKEINTLNTNQYTWEMGIFFIWSGKILKMYPKSIHYTDNLGELDG